MQWEWNDGLGHRNREPACMVALPDGTLYRFSGVTIPAVAVVVNEKHERNGKWSNTTYTVLSPDGTAIIAWLQSWEEGVFWPFAYWHEAVAWLRGQAPQCSAAQVEVVIRQYWGGAAAKFDANRHAAEEMGAVTGRRTIILTNRPGVVAWLAQRGITGKVMSQASISDIAGAIVATDMTLRVPVMAAAAEIIAVEMRSGFGFVAGDVTPAELDAGGAKTIRYVVTCVYGGGYDCDDQAYQ